MNLIALFAFIITFSFLVRTLRNIFHLVFLWQLKEYRLDRMFAHLKTPVGRKLVLDYLPVVKWILFFGILADIFLQKAFLLQADLLSGMYYFLFWLIWVFEALLNIREFILYRWRLPQFTVKAVFILTTVLFVLSSMIFDINVSFIIGKTLLFGPFLDRLLWLLISIVIGLFAVPSILYKKILIYQARRKMQDLSDLKVIGITGSYGKTSTKEFLAAILGGKYRIVKTPDFCNTDIGVAKYILGQLRPGHEIFVVEMGAYKKGEIKAICDIVKPKIGIITGINEQHMELFGSLANTKKTKFELIESLPEDGIAIFNGNNNHCRQMLDWAKKLGLATYGFKTDTNTQNIKIFTDHIEFDLIRKNKNYPLKVNLLGKQAIENVLAAIYAAESLGMSLGEIQEGISKIVSPDKTMKLVAAKNDLLLVDDTFNANPDGVMAALEYMKEFSGKKILVLTPLIELGDRAAAIHKKIAKRAEEVCDEIFLTNKNFSREFTNKAHILDKDTFMDLSGLKHALIVFEGKEAARILKQLTSGN